jgi:hypothetical protein
MLWYEVERHAAAGEVYEARQYDAMKTHLSPRNKQLMLFRWGKDYFCYPITITQ